MIKARQRYYLWLFLSIALFSGLVIYLFTRAGDIPELEGMALAGGLTCIGLFLLLIILRQKARDWRIILFSGERVQGRIKSVESNIWLNSPVIIHYTYTVDGKDFEGSAWTTNHFLDSVPKVGSECLVVYDKRNPQWSVAEELLKPPTS